MVEIQGSERSEHKAVEGEFDDRERTPKTGTKKDKTIKHVKHTPQLQFDDWQNRFIDTIGDKILCCGRQVGKSEICGYDASLYAINHDNENILMIAPTERQAYELFLKTLNYLLNNHKWAVKMGKDRPTKTEIKLTNGTKIYCLPTGQSGIGVRGYTIHRLYVDEASRVPDDVWEAVYPMLASTGGNIILLSTPFGKQGEFYKVWINEDGAYDSFTRFSVTTEIVYNERPLSEIWTEKRKERAMAFVEKCKKRFSKRQYAQEMLGEFSDELFRLFSDDIISKCCIIKPRPIVTQREFKEFYAGVDIARLGEDHTVFSVLQRLDSEHIQQVDNIIMKYNRTNQTYDYICQMENQWKFKKIGIDAGSGSLGVGILDFLLKTPIVRKKVVALNNRSRSLDRDEKSKMKLFKEDMYINLLSMMERGIIKLLDDEDVIDSLRSVQYEYLMQHGELTKVNIFSSPHNLSDVTEALMRAAFLANEKHLNMRISYI